MAKNHPAKKYPHAPPPTIGARNDVSAALVALDLGGQPMTAPLGDRGRVAGLAYYWGRKLGRRFALRKIGSDLVVWRVA